MIGGVVLALAGSGHALEVNTNLMARFSKPAQEQLRLVVKESPKLVAAWQEVMLEQEAIKAASVIFGVEARRAAEKRLVALRESEKNLRTRFTPEYDAVRKPLAKQIESLRDQAFKMRETPEESRGSAGNAKLARADAEINAIDAKLRLLDEMEKALTQGLVTMSTTTTLLGLDIKDPATSQLVAKYPTVVEARKAIVDCETDLAALGKAPPPGPGGAGAAVQRKAALDAMLAKARVALDAEVAKAGKLQTEETAKLKRKIESCDKQIEEAEKRKRPVSERVATERATMQTTLLDMEKNLEMLDLLAGRAPAAAGKAAPPAVK